MTIKSQREVLLVLVVLIGVVLVEGVWIEKGEAMKEKAEKTMIQLPRPDFANGMALDKTLANRRSQRHFSDRPLTLVQVGRLLWAAQGVTDERGFRTAPSAGALYPLEVYLVNGRTEGLGPGIYHYFPATHQLSLVHTGDQRSALSQAGLSQRSLADAPASIVITGVVRRTADKYGDRARRYVLMEVGHAGQNVLLEAESMDLGAVPVGAFKDKEVHDLLELGGGEEPFYIIPVGYPEG